MRLKLKELRIKKGMSRRELYTLVGISPSYYTEIEHGKYIPSLAVICKLKRALGCTLEELVDCGEE